MEHQVFVPAAVERLTEALADPARVARALPGFQQDAGAEPVAGRLKLRVGGSSVTYRGTLRITPRGDGAYAVEGAAAEARGTGTATLALTLRPAAAEGGATVTAAGTAEATGRITELPPDAVSTALTRLLTRFVAALTDTEADAVTETDAAGAEPGADGADGADEPDEPDEPGADEPDGHVSVFDTEIPPPSLDPDADQGSLPDALSGAVPDAVGDGPDEPPVEAAHARRTMIGRSAEEVDHAPPRGRYAPVPAPRTATAGQTLRWAAPAAALALASAIVVGRALRRRG